MVYQSRIKAFYQENPQMSGQEMLERLHITHARGIKTFWRELNEIQVDKRGLYPGRRRNTHAHNKSVRRGNIYFIPPKERD